MATRVTLVPLSTDADAPVLVAKTKLANDRRDRAAEASWLERAARPGVIPLADEPPPFDTDDFTIVTVHVGSRTLRTAGLDPVGALRVMVGVTELLVDLHRDGFVHGKLTVDHVIIGAERAWLCSPDGTAEDPGEDLDGLARCLHELQHQWEEQGRQPPFGARWTELAERLADDTDPSRSAARALHTLRRLESESSRAADPAVARRLPAALVSTVRGRGGLVFAAAAVALAIGPMFLIEPTEPMAATGPRIEVDGAVYAVGGQGDDVVVLPSPCDPSTPVVVLQADTDTIWAFDEVADGAPARAVAVVPGATDVRAEWVPGDQPCTVVVARGPAGASIVDTSSET